MYQSTFLPNYRAILKALSKRRNLLFKECPQFIDQIITFITKLYELDYMNSKGYHNNIFNYLNNPTDENLENIFHKGNMYADTESFKYILSHTNLYKDDNYHQLVNEIQNDTKHNLTINSYDYYKMEMIKFLLILAGIAYLFNR